VVSGDTSYTGKVDRQRLWDRHLTLAGYGALPDGGVDRQAMTPADAEARRQLVAWASDIGLTASVDAIGNLFLRRAGRRDDLAPVMTGSHLDTQPTGGKFDGAFGVLAGLEALTALAEAEVATTRPIELVIWNNEEGCRFPPTTMGSSAFTGHLPLDQALDARDRQGIRVADALDEMNRRTQVADTRILGGSLFAYLEAHIEQGPRLEEAGYPLGVVTGIQGLRWFEVEVLGTESHAGTTPRANRRDALQAAVTMIHELAARCSDREDILRFTVGRLDVSPNAPNTVPARVRFTIDLRHPDAESLQHYGDLIAPLCHELAGHCTVAVHEQPVSQPIRFDADIQRLLCECADSCGVPYQLLPSGATHDAKWLSLIAPSGMLFTPCAGGLSHNTRESADPDDLARATQVLTAALKRLANDV
jgi:beta-ureidopropionase / N-carbamoyl-L-amino-acid hydrolase